MDTPQRIVGQKLLDLANIEAGVLLFGQFTSTQGVQWRLIGLGFVVFLVLYIIWYILLLEGETNVSR
ncbi:MAG: hypothetical protein HYZ72_08700 [Deltaproteobacteria bacterium]|nr:hypothetical protein [Deltaproteobacteria bacterium]